MIEGVIFDIGGVLAQDIWEYLLPARNKADGIAEKFGLDKEQVHKVGELLWEAFAYIPETPRNTRRELERRYWDSFIKFFWGKTPPEGASIDEFIRMTSSYINLVDPEMPQFLETLCAKGIKLGICSNNNEFWFKRQMDELKLYRYFSPSKIILSCRVGVSKSSDSHEMFHAAAEAMNLNFSSCAFIDDRENNTKRAQECGMKGIVFEGLSELRKSLNVLEHG
jgi:HAD superfamily hydrolase (TIGR01509 family)